MTYLNKTKTDSIASENIRVQLSKVAAIESIENTFVPQKNGFHLSVKVISRSAGRCVLHCVAYRSACQMRGGNDEIVADYTPRRGVTHCEILLPEDSPAWANDRNSLWIEAAKAEKRVNSIEAREFEVSIPYGLSREAAIGLAREFARELIAKHGFAVDFSLHLDNRKKWTGECKNQDGYHVHFLATTRRISAQGFTEKTRELDVKSSGVIFHWRKRWEALANEFLSKNGSEKRIDHRSNRARGISIPPTRYLGPEITALERKGIRTELGKLNREILQVASVPDIKNNMCGILQNMNASSNSKCNRRLIG